MFIDLIAFIEPSNIDTNKHYQTSHMSYETGRLYPSKITDRIYLSNWGIASDAAIYRIMPFIKCVINCTYDHPNMFDANENNIYYQQMMADISIDNKLFAIANQQNKVMKIRNNNSDIRLSYFRVPIIDNTDNDAYSYFMDCCDFVDENMKC